MVQQAQPQLTDRNLLEKILSEVRDLSQKLKSVEHQVQGIQNDVSNLKRRAPG